MQDNTHFKHIFWLIVGCCASVLAYIFVITFVPIPKENIRFADTSQGFLLGTVLGGCLAYLLSGSPFQTEMKKTQPPGTTNAEISASITTEPEKPSSADTSTVEVKGFKKL